jgi:hypothetical protein
MAKSGYKGISRIDQPSRNTFGWYVRVMFNGTTRCKFFSDKAGGSKHKALEAAIKYRNQVEKELGRPRTDRLVSSGSGKNESGVTGVNIQKQIVRTGEGEREVKKYYVVNWSPWPGKTCRELVSIEKYGERGALLKACRIRREKEREMYGSEVKGNWTASLGKLLSV